MKLSRGARGRRRARAHAADHGQFFIVFRSFVQRVSDVEEEEEGDEEYARGRTTDLPLISLLVRVVTSAVPH